MLSLFFALAILFSCKTEAPKQEQTTTQKVENRGTNKENWWDKLPRPDWKAFQQIETESDWFEVYQITPDVVAIYEPGQFEEVISYLIIGTEKALLWDTGLGIGDIKKIVDQLTDLDIIVLNSHTHIDHVGGNYQFETIYGLDTDFTKKNTAGRSHQEAKEYVNGDWVWKPFPTGFVKDQFESKPFTISHFVKHQDQIDLGEIIIEVLHTPGHTPDAICLLDRKNRLIFTGDTFYPAPLYAHFGESNVETYLKTAKFLATLTPEVDHILPSHNVPWLSNVYLQRMADAFQTIKDGKGVYIETDGAKEYAFEGFSIITK